MRKEKCEERRKGVVQGPDHFCDVRQIRPVRCVTWNYQVSVQTLPKTLVNLLQGIVAGAKIRFGQTVEGPEGRINNVVGIRDVLIDI